MNSFYNNKNNEYVLLPNTNKTFQNNISSTNMNQTFVPNKEFQVNPVGVDLIQNNTSMTNPSEKPRVVGLNSNLNQLRSKLNEIRNKNLESKRMNPIL